MDYYKNLKVPFEIVKDAKPYYVNPYTSGVEKAFLEYQVMQVDKELVFDAICSLLEIPEDLPKKIKMAWIYRCREISFGSDFTIRYKCPGCGRVTESTLLLEKLLSWGVPRFQVKDNFNLSIRDIQSTAPSEAHKYFKDAMCSTLSDFMAYYNDLTLRIPRVRNTLGAQCMFSCGHIHKVSPFSLGFLVDSLSDHDITNMMKTYHVLVTNGFTKADVDSMLPFEREVQKGLIEARNKELLEYIKK